MGPVSVDECGWICGFTLFVLSGGRRRFLGGHGTPRNIGQIHWTVHWIVVWLGEDRRTASAQALRDVVHTPQSAGRPEQSEGVWDNLPASSDSLSLS